ncbi:hypothetical protein JYG23_03745 [Sedimentibacter sp. zth1]|nr:hypothetical protein [Sedimentibacter sp. zth1]QSX06580.1 hypothetical protein JYG23_03745 [Sedimentibacter sp. zth1]
MFKTLSRYWDKFGAIVGKLYLANNLDLAVQIYYDGIDKFIEKILA